MVSFQILRLRLFAQIHTFIKKLFRIYDINEYIRLIILDQINKYSTKHLESNQGKRKKFM